MRKKTMRSKCTTSKMKNKINNLKCRTFIVLMNWSHLNNKLFSCSFRSFTFSHLNVQLAVLRLVPESRCRCHMVILLWSEFLTCVGVLSTSWFEVWATVTKKKTGLEGLQLSQAMGQYD